MDRWNESALDEKKLLAAMLSGLSPQEALSQALNSIQNQHPGKFGGTVQQQQQQQQQLSPGGNNNNNINVNVGGVGSSPDGNTSPGGSPLSGSNHNGLNSPNGNNNNNMGNNVSAGWRYMDLSSPLHGLMNNLNHLNLNQGGGIIIVIIRVKVRACSGDGIDAQ